MKVTARGITFQRWFVGDSSFLHPRAPPILSGIGIPGHVLGIDLGTHSSLDKILPMKALFTANAWHMVVCSNPDTLPH